MAWKFWRNIRIYLVFSGIDRFFHSRGGRCFQVQFTDLWGRRRKNLKKCLILIFWQNNLNSKIKTAALLLLAFSGIKEVLTYPYFCNLTSFFSQYFLFQICNCLFLTFTKCKYFCKKKVGGRKRGGLKDILGLLCKRFKSQLHLPISADQ